MRGSTVLSSEIAKPASHSITLDTDEANIDGYQIWVEYFLKYLDAYMNTLNNFFKYTTNKYESY